MAGGEEEVSDRLQEIRARLDAATPGPWRVIEPLQQTARPVRRMIVADLEAAQQSSEIGNVQMSWFDTRFTTHAPADIAWLLDEVERLRRDDSVVQGVTKRECSDD